MDALTLSTEIAAPCRLGVISHEDTVRRFACQHGLTVRPERDVCVKAFAELVIPPCSSLIAKSPIDILLLKTCGLDLMATHRGAETLCHVKTYDHAFAQIGLVPLKAGDILVAHLPDTTSKQSNTLD